MLRLEGAVAVVADHFWAAKQGLAAAAPRFDDGPNANVSTASIVADMAKVSEGTGAVTTNKGDALKTLAAQDGGRRIDAVYEMPFLAHATMEPMNCTVDLRADGCDLWVGTQVPALAQGAAAKTAGLPVEKVKVHNYYIGGGFGRRLEVDYVIQAVAFAKLAKGPVKFIWTREEDIQHDMYRPYYYDRLSAKLDNKGMPTAWFHRVTGSSIMARFAPPAVKDGVDPDAVEGAADLQYAIPAMRVEYVRHEPPGVPTAFWRGVGPTHNVFVVESFIDELAQAARQDPVVFRRALLEKSPRALGVLNLAAEKAGWDGTRFASEQSLLPFGDVRLGINLYGEAAYDDSFFDWLARSRQPVYSVTEFHPLRAMNADELRRVLLRHRAHGAQSLSFFLHPPPAAGVRTEPIANPYALDPGNPLNGSDALYGAMRQVMRR